jgi:hypothetical protein
MTKQLTLKGLRDEFLSKTNPSGSFQNSIVIPNVQNVEKYMETLDPSEKKEFRRSVVEKVFEDLTERTKSSITNARLRTEIISETAMKSNTNCRICRSIFYSVYLEWLTIDNKTYAECSRLSNVCFGEVIDPQSFSNHKRNHLFKTKAVRRAIIFKNPDINPKKVAEGMIQLLVEEIIQDEEVDQRKAKIVNDYIKVLDQMEKTKQKQAPLIDASQTNIQINQSGVPIARDTRRLLDADWSEEKQKKLEDLQVKWHGKGTSKIKNEIPTDVPKIKKEKNFIDAEIVKD